MCVVIRPPKLPKKQPAQKGTASAKALDKMGPDGQVSTKTALQAFALTIAPLPGAHVPRGPPGTGLDGSEAVRAVIAHWDDLTPSSRPSCRRPSPARRSAVRAVPAAPADERRERLADRDGDARPVHRPLAPSPSR